MHLLLPNIRHFELKTTLLKYNVKSKIKYWQMIGCWSMPHISCIDCKSWKYFFYDYYIFFIPGIYILFTVMLMWLRKSHIELDTEELDSVIAKGRSVSTGWSLHLGWVAFFFCFVSGVSWCLMSVELKKTRMNFMYSSNYDQICSM